MRSREPNGRFRPRWADDPFDPRGWPVDLPWRTIWLDPDNDLFAIVDNEDYGFLTRWLWRATPNSTGSKFYATRVTRIGPRSVKIYMHKLILSRREPAPSPSHIIGDHLNSDSLDNRRRNLRWATPSMNRRNSHGAFLRQYQLDLAS